MCSKYSTETAAEAFTRLSAKVVLTLSIPLFKKPVKPGEIYQVSGESGSGKTLFLLDIAKECILDKQNGGLEIGVVFIACGKSFPWLTFIEMLEATVKKKAGSSKYGLLEKIVMTCLSRFQYMEVLDSDEFTRGLARLEHITFAHPNLARVLLIDDVTTFCWLDIDHLTAKQGDHCRKLKRFVTEHNTAIFAANRISGDSRSKIYKSKVNGLLRYCWSKVITDTITLAEDKTTGRFKASLKDQTVYFQIKDERIEYQRM
ncbi:unnamed protein product [Soboliphyme baturini]|uniref:AAA domain-containing protein n=1 Tax=Soboliphyme baturini TaxID=241478 RepID=A0A183IF38_9BILA|nr:unnamed protein product [Soboliphyme baturini]